MTAKPEPKKAGRPKGVQDPSARARVEKNLPKIYDAVLRNAVTGDAAAAVFCVDLVRHPEKYPHSDRRP